MSDFVCVFIPPCSLLLHCLFESHHVCFCPFLRSQERFAGCGASFWSSSKTTDFRERHTHTHTCTHRRKAIGLISWVSKSIGEASGMLLDEFWSHEALIRGFNHPWPSSTSLSQPEQGWCIVHNEETSLFNLCFITNVPESLCKAAQMWDFGHTALQ